MTGYLLDTNVLSELLRPRPDPNVIAFLSNGEASSVSVVTLHEMWFGVARLPAGQRRQRFFTAVAELLAGQSRHVVDVTQTIARIAADCRATRERMGRPTHLPDSLIAGTALHLNLTLATRNVPDFDHLGIDVIDPWQSV